MKHNKITVGLEKKCFCSKSQLRLRGQLITSRVGFSLPPFLAIGFLLIFGYSESRFPLLRGD